MSNSRVIARRSLTGAFVVAVAVLSVAEVSAQNAAKTAAAIPGNLDPGPRGGAAAAGGPLAGLGPDEIKFFKAAKAQFITVDSVTGNIDGESGSGLGPRFNGNVCSACHIFPAAGGSSPKVNPQVKMATLDGAKNSLPYFVTADGPVREARFVLRPDGTPDGQVHQLFTIAGRTDAPACKAVQPSFSAQKALNNVALRIPTGLFGLGLIENMSDTALRQANADHAAQKRALGVEGHFNTNSNDGTISRFGWKAQDKSLLIFSGEAYNVEQGVTNEVFPNATDDNPTCQYTNGPEDGTFFVNGIHSGSSSSDFSSAAVNFAIFIRLSAPPKPAAATPSITSGQALFHSVGCESCHFDTLTSGTSIYTNQSNVTFHPFSDFEVHRMGVGLRDGIAQGSATGDEFRTAPLWGVGQRNFFLHDGRTSNLVDAIKAHQSNGSQANAVIAKFNALTDAQAQNLIAFLRSL